MPISLPDWRISLHGKDEGWKQEGQVDHDSSGEHSHQIRPENESVLRTEAEEASSRSGQDPTIDRFHSRRRKAEINGPAMNEVCGELKFKN
jgi:hypothetical protein